MTFPNGFRHFSWRNRPSGKNLVWFTQGEGMAATLPTNYQRWDLLDALAKFQDLQPLVAQVFGGEPCSTELKLVLKPFLPKKQILSYELVKTQEVQAWANNLMHGRGQDSNSIYHEPMFWSQGSATLTSCLAVMLYTWHDSKIDASIIVVLGIGSGNLLLDSH